MSWPFNIFDLSRTLGELERARKVLAQVKTGLVEQLPAVYDHNIDIKVASLVKEIIPLRRDNPDADVSNLEREVDELICGAFDLSGEEMAIILGAS